MTTIIGLCGPAGAGKTTVAKFLCERYGAVRYSLAGPLKEIAQRTLGFSDEQMYGTQAQKEAPDPRYGFSPRWFLQRLGTEGIRAVLGADVWIDCLMGRITRERPKIAVVDDVRFANEAAALRAEWCDVWRLTPPPPFATSSTHASETEWTKAQVDYEIAPLLPGVDVLESLAAKRMDALIRESRRSPDVWL